MNKDFTFRIHVVRAPSTALNINTNVWKFTATDNQIIMLSSPHPNDPEVTIQKSRDLIIKSSGWKTENEAKAAAEKYMDLFRICFVKLRIGINYGFDLPKSMYTEYGLNSLSQQNGQRTLQDIHGIMVYETNPPPVFQSLNAKMYISKSEESIFKTLEYALQHNIELSIYKKLSIDLFNASFFQEAQSTRFMLLIMAIEALFQREEKSIIIMEHINNLINITNENKALSLNEKQSIISSLENMKFESINQMGRKLSKERLGSKLYDNKAPESFFTYCYSLRSRIVHGSADDNVNNNIKSVVATLEVFVSDLLSVPLTDITF